MRPVSAVAAAGFIGIQQRFGLMAMSIETVLAEMSLRVRLLMSAENAGKRIAGLSERETAVFVAGSRWKGVKPTAKGIFLEPRNFAMSLKF